MSKRLTETEIDQALRSIAASYERNLAVAKKTLREEMEGVQIYGASLENIIKAQALSMLWRQIVRRLDDHAFTPSAHLDHFRCQAQEFLTTWEPIRTTSDMYRITDREEASAQRRFLFETKGMI